MIKNSINHKEFVDCYLFGSMIYSETPSDIDVAIVYDKRHVDVYEAIQYRKDIITWLSESNNMDVDAILLSKEEEKEMEFLANAKHILL